MDRGIHIMGVAFMPWKCLYPLHPIDAQSKGAGDWEI